MDDTNLRVSLVEKRGETSIFIDAEIDDEGRLVVSGQDIGRAPKEFWGDSDYEYWVIIPPEEKDKLLLALIELVYKDDLYLVSKFRDFLSQKGIKRESGSWV
ncbi:MAG: hypothetical protein ACFFED_06980 [Candidatus Thorarchaeota archaeon]